MPADLTAAALIALLRERPGACEMLGCDVDHSLVLIPRIGWTTMAVPANVETAVTMLTGDAVEKHVELGLDFPKRRDEVWERRATVAEIMRATPGAGMTRTEPTLLHALLAGLEAHAKQ